MSEPVEILKGRAAVWAGACGRCPNCGQGRLFTRWMRIAPKCAVCHYLLDQVRSGDGAASFIMQLTGLFVGMPALGINLAYHPPLWLNLLVFPPLAVVFATALMQPGKGVMTALNLLRSRD